MCTCGVLCGSIAKHSVYAVQSTFYARQGDRQLHIPNREVPCCCTCGLPSVPVTIHSFYAVVLVGPTARQVVPLCREWRLCNSDAVSSCVLPVPAPSSLYTSQMDWGCICDAWMECLKSSSQLSCHLLLGWAYFFASRCADLWDQRTLRT